MYDHLGKLLVANLIWAVVVGVPGVLGLSALATGDRGAMVMLGLPLLTLSGAILLPIMTAGLAHMAKELIDTRDGSLGDFFRGIRLYWRRAASLGIVYWAITACLASSVWFYASQLRSSVPWLGYAISAAALWGLIFMGLMGLMLMPALVQKKEGVFGTLKLAALLVLDNPLFSAGLAVQFIIIAGLSIMPPFLFLASGSLGAVLATSAYEILARKYAHKQALAEGHVFPLTKNGVEFGDEEDDYLNRGFRDALFPWKG
ncbi:MAG: hypothetical protein NTU83_05900 [Candidatus Hydrogenedentes bacterium]|nr:hypothetical protein [Candidatus Hydrogenedentota bacterium]